MFHCFVSLCKICLSHFAILVTLCSNFLSYFVIISEWTGTKEPRPKPGTSVLGSRTWKPETWAQDLGPETQDSQNRTDDWNKRLKTYNRAQNIWEKYLRALRKSSISIFQDFFARIYRIFILERRLGTRA